MSTSSQPTVSSADKEEEQDYIPSDRASNLMHDEKYINERLHASERTLNQLSALNKKKYKRLKKAEIIIAATIPFAVTLSSIPPLNQGEAETVLTIYAGIGGAVLALMNNVLKMGGFFDKWKDYRSRAELLKREEYLYMTRMPPYESPDAFPALVERVEHIITEPEEESSQPK
ncbi:MAG: DUF4231 domain-containing protein [Cyclobacteriaceae bacterium]|nr:DUF4231 domain-containing protein [Cyclobacteriaceae bacterium HetDA_MAG_MS6]